MVPLRFLVFMLLAGSLLAGCAQSTGTGTTQLVEPLAAQAAGGGYQLNDDERSLDCGKLTGRMKVRILSMRGHTNKTQPTGLAEGIKSATKTVWGQDGPNLDARYLQDRAMLEAYNRRLAEQKCATFDLESELGARVSAPLPEAITPAKPPAVKK